MFSWTVTHQAVYPAFAEVAPYAIVVVETDEGVRLVTNLRDGDTDGLELGRPLVLTIDVVDDAIGLPYARFDPQTADRANPSA